MKFTIDRNLFLEKLQIALKAVGSKTAAIPVLSGILINCSQDTLTLTTSNTEISIKVTINDVNLKIEEDGKCLIPSGMPIELIRNLREGDVTVELKQDSILTVQSGVTDSVINLLEVEDYPEPNFELSSKLLNIKTSLLNCLIRETSFAAAKDGSKPILMGVNFRVKGNEIIAVATDSFRLSKKSAILDEEYENEINIVISAKTLNELSKILGEDNEIIEVYILNNKIIFKKENILFQTKMIDGKYPSVDKIMRTEFRTLIKYDKEELIASVKRVSVSQSSQSATIKMIIDENGKTTLISNTSENGKVTDVINPIEIIKLSPITIFLNASLLAETLRSFDSGNVFLELNGSKEAVFFEGENDEGLIGLISPLNL